MVKNTKRKFVKGDTCMYGNETFSVTGVSRSKIAKNGKLYYTIRNRSGTATVRSDHLIAC